MMTLISILLYLAAIFAAVVVGWAACDANAQGVATSIRHEDAKQVRFGVAIVAFLAVCAISLQVWSQVL